MSGIFISGSTQGLGLAATASLMDAARDVTLHARTAAKLRSVVVDHELSARPGQKGRYGFRYRNFRRGYSNFVVEAPLLNC